MPDVFISYSRRDSRDFVARLAADLEARGKDPWVDLEDIPPASRWEEDLREGVAASDAFCFVISPGSVGSEHCRAELAYAVERNKRLVPVNHLEVDDAAVPEPIGSHNWIPQQGAFDDDFEASVATLIEAIETDLDWVKAHTRWGARAEEWDRRGRDRSLLARGSDLTEAEAFLAQAASRRPEPTELQGAYVVASREAASRRQRQVFGAVSLAMLVAIALAIFALIQRNSAIDQRETARADELASDSTANLESDPELSLILALEGARTKATDRTADSLRRALLASHVRVRIESDTQAPIDAVVLSPDGAHVAVAIEDGTVIIGDADSGDALTTLDTGTAFASDVAFAQDGETLYSSDAGGRVTAWAVPSGERLSSFRAADSELLTLALSPDEKSVAVGAQGGDVSVFALDGRELESFGPLADRVNAVTFSPDGKQLLSASNDLDAGVRVWDVSGGRPPLTLGDDGALDARFSPSGDRIASANLDGSGGTIWDAATGERVGRPLEPTGRGFITRVAWVPTGDAVITAGQGGDVTAYDLRSREPIDRYRGHGGFILDVTTTADGNRLLTAGEDGTARIWDVGLRSAAIGAPVASDVQFSPDSKLLLYADGLAEVVEAPSGHEVGSVLSEGVVHGVAFDPTGERFATAEDATAELFDVKTGKHIGGGFEQKDPGGLFAVGWSADGSRLMTAGSASGVTVWNVDDHTVVGRVPVESDRDALFDAVMSPDGVHVATIAGGDDATITDVEGDSPPQTLHGHTSSINEIAYDAEGERLITASNDGTARVWDAGDGSLLLALNNDGNEVHGAAFSGDGQLIATTGVDGEMRVWDAASGRELLRLQGADASPALNEDGSLIAGADSFSGQVSIYECDLCAADLDRLEALAAERITRAPTERERELYLDR